MTISQQNDHIERESLLPISILGSYIVKEVQPAGQGNHITQSKTETAICRGYLYNASSFYKKRQYKSLEDFQVNNKIICDEMRCLSKSEYHVTLGKCLNITKENQASMGELENKTLKSHGEHSEELLRQQRCLDLKTKSCSSMLGMDCTPQLYRNSIVGPIFSDNGDSRLLTSREISQSSESIICRICHSYGDDTLIAPCKCCGSSRYVHAHCLVTWFKKCVKNECELCKSEVKIRKIYHKLSLWRKPEDRPIPLIWFSVFFIGLVVNILSIYVNASEGCRSTACLIFYGVNGFGIALDVVFLCFWYHRCRLYLEKWCTLNQDWFIDVKEEDQTIETVLQVQYVRNENETAIPCMV